MSTPLPTAAATGAATVDPQRAALNAAFKIGTALGRPFAVTDLGAGQANTPTLMRAALLYANAYVGDFSFMLDMRREAAKGILTVAQSKGTLNCLMAEGRRRQQAAARARAAAPTSGPASAPNAARFAGIATLRPSRYRVELPNGTLAVRIEPAKQAHKGLAILTRIQDEWLFQGTVSLAGAPDLMRRAPALLGPALDVLIGADDALVYGLAYAMEGNECAFCGRDLDTAESISAGYGPRCAEKHSLAWGDKAVPARVILARAAAEGASLRAPAPLEEPQRIGAAPGALPVPGRTRTYAEIFGEDYDNEVAA